MENLANLKDEELLEEIGRLACSDNDNAIIAVIEQIIVRVQCNSAWTNSDAKITARLIRLAIKIELEDFDMAHQSQRAISLGMEYAIRKKYLLLRMQQQSETAFMKT